MLVVGKNHDKLKASRKHTKTTFEVIDFSSVVFALNLTSTVEALGVIFHNSNNKVTQLNAHADKY